MSIVISVENLSKTYRLGQIGTGTFAHDLSVWWARVRGKPNPLLRIGESEHGNRDGEEIWALKDVSFTVEQGEVLGIIGRNGAGKSTLLKILSRVTAPTSGRIRVKGRIASLLEVGTGFHPELTGRENIYLNGAIMGMSHKEIESKFDEIVDFADIATFVDTPVKRYSSGMYVRLAFSVAAHLEPEILLIDEVLAVGDTAFQKKCLGKMGDVAGEGRTVLFVSHNMNAVRSLCHRCALLSNGKLTLLDETNQVIEKYLNFVNNTNENSSIQNWSMETAPGSDYIKLRSMQIKNRCDEPSTTFQADEDIKLEFHYTVLKKLSGFHFQFSFYSADGIEIFTTTDMIARTVALLPGDYQTICTIPRNLFNQHTYEIRFAGGIPHDRAHIKPFSIAKIQVLGGSHGSYFSDWPGLIAPKADWQIDIQVPHI